MPESCKVLPVIQSTCAAHTRARKCFFCLSSVLFGLHQAPYFLRVYRVDDHSTL